ncbi:MAG: dTDP-4-amino-4,6-dideoxygalactose transaminase [Bacteroidota bacterium]
MIPFNKPYLPLKSLYYLFRSALSGTIAGNGKYTKLSQRWFEKRFGFKKAILTSSCTDALEMSALLCELEPGDEVIMPSYTFMSTANAFLLRNARVVFADVLEKTPNINPGLIESLITPRTKAIVVVHYCGMACDMDPVMQLARKYNLKVVEDSAHAIDGYYKGKPLGSIGDFATFSFHETKNIISGEGGMLIVNDERCIRRAEIIWEKGTNRAAFYRGETDKYSWVDIGSSFLPSDVIAALLYTQMKAFGRIQSARKKLWWDYYKQLQPLESEGLLQRPVVTEYATVNGNFFYILLHSLDERNRLQEYLKKKHIVSVFHYFPLHNSPYFKDKHDGRNLPNTQRFSDCILRLPFYYGLTTGQVTAIVNSIRSFFR